MQKLFCTVLVLAAALSPAGLAGAQENSTGETGRAYYDFGVFAFEEKDYTSAENNLKIALELDPDNPFYSHWLGKTYLETGKYAQAGTYLNRAWDIRPEISGLKFDMAYLKYKTGDNVAASELFVQTAKEEPENVLARYYAGITLYRMQEYGKAADWFARAAEMSTTVRANALYHAGICWQKMGDIRQAEKMFEYVKDDPEAGTLRDSAIQWLDFLKKQEKNIRPYRVHLETGVRYDDNVSVEPDDTDSFTDESDWAFVTDFSGNYDIFSGRNHKTGIGFTQYNTWHSDLDEYDLSGSTGHLYSAYTLKPFTFRFNYWPSYYFAGSDSYLRQHCLEPEAIWHISTRLAARLSYRYKDNTWFADTDRSGHANEIFGDMIWSFFDGKGNFFGGIGYEDYSASGEDQYYDRWRSRAGGRLILPWDLSLEFSGEYQSKNYDSPDSFYGVEREDDRYILSLSLSRKLWHDWLGIMGEYRYTKNDSNIPVYEYTRNVSTLSLTLSY
ncbi:MAG: surface lipoprotein assembly modifier [Desulfococcaceae bacterium]